MLTKMNTRLNPDSTLRDMAMFDTIIDISEKVSNITDILKNDNLTPGIILMCGSEFYGMISRRKFFESMSQPFCLELYLKRTIDFLYENIQVTEALILEDSVLIADATILSLQRHPDHIYEPIVVKVQNEYKLIDIHQLLLTQSKIHQLTVNSLREANEFKSEVLSIASHDLKNPLNSIMGFSKMINEEMKKNIDPNNNSISEYATIIYDASQRMLELIIKLLDSSAIEASVMKLDKMQLDFIGLVKDLVNVNTGLAKKKDQYFLLNNFTKRKVLIEADYTMLRSAIDNLISNAIKYSPYNSIIEVNLKVYSSKVQFAITDQGPGIKEEEKGRLFGKFRKLSAKPTGGESSTGLGLFIAKQTILFHGGDIQIESEYGKGSTFIIELPLIKNDTFIAIDEIHSCLN